MSLTNEQLKTYLTIIKKTDKASATLLQRHLAIGFSEACKILDQLVIMGFVGEQIGAKPREIYLDKIEEFLLSID